MSADGFLLQRSPHDHDQDDRGASPPQGPGPSKPVYSKRGKITIVACVPCRRRKTKCDGKRPTCSQCSSRDGQCQYDMNEEQRRLTYLRENVETLAEEKSALEAVLWNLKNSTEDESFEILRRIRGGTDPQSLVQQIQASRSLTQVKGDTPLSSASLAYSISPNNAQPLNLFERLVHVITRASAPETDEIVSRLRRRQRIDQILDAANARNLLHPSKHTIPDDTNDAMDEDGAHDLYAVSHARPMAGNALTPMLGHQMLEDGRAPNAHTPPNTNEYRWTTVTDDKDFIEHLLDIYFMWQHCFFQSFPEELFRKDYAAGKTKYCSRVLVNAICAAGCLLSDRPEARGDRNDPETAGSGFVEEGIRLLNSADRSSIPTTAGVFLLSHVDGNRGRLGAMWGLVGRSARMALDLNLHLRNDKTPFDQLTGEAHAEESGRIHAFWGCFIADQVTSLTLGRLPQILTNAITVDLPPIDEAKDKEPWGPNGDSPRRPGARASTFQQCASLSKIVNSTLLMFFAPSQIIRGKLLLDEYSKYQSWYRRMPAIVASTENAPAHVLCLHIYYEAAILLLFRPFLRAKFTESDISPSDLCRQSAHNISDIFANHLSLYGVTGLHTFQIQCLLAACTIHIINLPAIASTTALTAACNHFQKLISCNTWALGSLNVIKGLIQKWSIILPGEVEEALYRSHADLPESMRNSSFDDPAAPQAEMFRPAKRTAFLNPSSQVMQKRQRLAPVHKSGSSSSHRSPTGAGGTSAIKEQTPNYLFAPFPNQPAPLLGPIHTSTSSDTEWNDELSKVAQDFDGLKFEGDGWFDPFMGFQGD